MLVQESNLDIVLCNILLLVKAGWIALNLSELDSCSECLQLLAKSACQATVYKRKCVVYKSMHWEVMKRNYENKFLAIKCIEDIKPN